MDLSPFLEPISPDAPAGPSLRFDFVYRQIELARAVDPAAPADGHARASAVTQVVGLATEALAGRSKDLQVAAWLAEAWTFRDGLPGLAAGAELLRGLLEEFWEHVHPQLEDGDAEMRAMPLEWLDRALPAAVQAVPLTRAGHGVRAYHDSLRVGHEPARDADEKVREDWTRAMEAGLVSADAFDPGLAATPPAWLAARRAEAAPARAAVEALERVCGERFGPAAPRFPALRGALDEYERVAALLLESRVAGAEPAPVGASGDRSPSAVHPPSPAADGPAATTSSPSADGAGAAFGDGRPAGAEEREAPGVGASDDSPGGSLEPASTVDLTPSAEPGPPRSRDEAAARMAALARWLRARDPADPTPYLMVRGFRWGELRAGGSGPDPRLLAAPPTERRVRLRTLALEERWAELLEAAEELMATEHGRGWLDLQRHVASACEALGPQYDAVGRAVAGALRSLLRDLPALPALALMDDTPAANAETLAWLRASGIAPAEEGADAPYAAPRAAAPEDRARARAAAGEPERAVRILVDAADREPSPRARFLLRARAAEVMVDAGLEAVAAPLLREMAAQVERHALEEWEAGEVAAHPLALLCRCLDRLGDAGGERGALYLRVCRLDPLRAIHLGGGADAAA